MFDTMLVRQSNPSHRTPVRLLNEPVTGNVIAFGHSHGLYPAMKRDFGTARVQIMSVEQQTVDGSPVFIVEFEPQAA
ncbi:hypothetical protein [Labrys neptuniae]